MRKLFRGLLFVTTALGAPLAAQAQAVTATDVAAEIDEVVVTAQKREQRLHDVPLPVSAVSGAQMAAQGITSTGDLTRVVPGLLFVKNAAFSMPSIRGIGTKSSSAGDASSVALYIDGVYISGQQAGIFDFGYVERVEVLKGPQGTLFGRNATGGAINIITRTPSATPFAEAEVGYGSYGLRTAKAYATGGISERARADIQGFYAEDNGYIKDIVTGAKLKSADNYGVRAKVVVDPTDELRFTFTAEHLRDYNNAGYAYFALGGSNNTTRLNPTAIIGREPYTGAYSFLPYQETTQTGVALTAELNLENVSFKSITAGRYMLNEDMLDSDATPLPASSLYIRAQNHSYSQEFIATSTGDGPFSWLGGLFLFREKAQRHPNISYPSGSQTMATVDTDAYAPYGELTYRFNDRLTVIGGLRYSYEKKHLTNWVNGIPRVNDGDSWDNLDYRLTAQYTVDPTLNFYLTNSTGFKSGAYNSTSTNNPPVFPETVDAWTLGLKYARHGVTLHADAFHYDWQDIQIQRSVDPAVGTTLLQNAAAAKIKGIELELRAPIGSNFDGNLGLTWMKGEYTSFPNADVLIPRPGGGNIGASIDVTGRPTFRTPEWTFNAGLNYHQDLLGGAFRANGAVYYHSEFSWEPSNRVREKAVALVSARASWSPPSERWKVSVWGENLTDEFYFGNVNTSTGGDTGSMGSPRRFGVTLSMQTN